ncbi:FecR family protein [Thalassococcus sp. S3]|uniref:FecR family protein n=1 Tax=Thalassococcus sp. S3 TaxID=2017482 RepID=UPI001023F9C3|nr:FecR domain-containing protein [Thalassococcus sp. S3]QBF32545.1 hypothetical protein CFI11_15155 [Thalassococcus sp. S3]
MSDDTNRDPARQKLAEEAARILRRLDEDPDDHAALKDRDAFLARGRDAKRIYAVMARGFAAAPKTLKDRDRRYSIGIVGGVLALLSLAFAWEPLKVAWLADYTTRLTTEIIELESGDTTTLDASSAIQEETNAKIRTVDLLKGAGFFDVDDDGRRFIVQAGNVTAEALGTAFEVMRLGDDVIITVADGIVEVTGAGQIRQLTEGKQIRVSPFETSIRSVEPDTVAGWRRDRLTIGGMTFGEVASVIERRMSGRVFVISNRLADDPVAGALDLSMPRNALKTLAATSGASVVEVSPYLTIIYSR